MDGCNGPKREKNSELTGDVTRLSSRASGDLGVGKEAEMAEGSGREALA